MSFIPQLRPVDPIGVVARPRIDPRREAFIQKLRNNPRDRAIAREHGITTDQLAQVVHEFGPDGYFLIIDCFHPGVPFSEALRDARELMAIEGQ